MKVLIAVDPDYGSREHADLGDAFWLVESAPNRALAEKAWAAGSTDQNSALFHPDPTSSADEEVVDRFDDADLHHPTWMEIEFVGVELSPSLKQHFDQRRLVIVSKVDGFTITR